MNELLIVIFSGIGSLAILIASIGILRMPDFYLRLSVTIKAATLGIGLLLAASAVFFGEISVTTKVVAITFFLFLTAPVAAHMIGRASYFIGTPLWKGSVLDELKDKYDKVSHELGSEEEPKTTGSSSNGRIGEE